MSAKRVCIGCGALIDRGPRCVGCTSQRNAALPSREARGYTYRWRLLSAKYRRLTPWCELRYEGCQSVAVDTDHRIPVRAGGKSVWNNCQAVCRPCHARKTREDARRYPNGAAA